MILGKQQVCENVLTVIRKIQLHHRLVTRCESRNRNQHCFITILQGRMQPLFVDMPIKYFGKPPCVGLGKVQ